MRNDLPPVDSDQTSSEAIEAKFRTQIVCLTEKKLSRDWVRFPATIKVVNHSALYVVSDIHGHFDAFFESLRNAGLIEFRDKGNKSKPSNFEWIAGKSVLVVAGDLINKGTQSIRTLKFAQNLEIEAAKHGGKTIFLSGNHEIGFIGNPLSTKYDMFRSELIETGEDLCDSRESAGKQSFAQWMLNQPAAAIVNGVYISHSGYVNGSTFEQINREVTKHLTAWDWDSPFLCGSPSGGKSNDGFFNSNGWWANSPDSSKVLTEEQMSLILDKNLEALGVRQIIFGHDPNPFDSKLPTEGMFRNGNGRGIFKIDGGMGNGSGELVVFRCQKWQLAEGNPSACISPEYLLHIDDKSKQQPSAKFESVPWSKKIPKPKFKDRSGC